ncbi:MAG: class I SAM-dependent methyltransferase, partial [Candidatus Lokiarchaeota archaeon]|nr:class I SAM-dependent methyltransferase [Candidatus Lokiarchaeota archaeon]
VARLLKAKGQARIQHRLAARALNGLAERFPGSFEMECECPLALDLGCGLGFTSDVLIEAGFTAVGVDVLVDMLSASGARGAVAANAGRARYHRAMATATALPFRDATFALAASVSAVQWLSAPGELQALSGELARTCKPGACIAIQHYPRSSSEMVELGSAIKRGGFNGGILVDNPENPRKRKVFLLARKGG